jgi:acyl-CoA thioesterase YciA
MPVLCAIAMPADTNPQGDIFGGWLLSQMDLAGVTVAMRQAHGHVVTAAITAMSFDRRVFIGDEVTCYAEVVEIGRTSIAVKVESWVRRGVSDAHIKVTEGHFTYVAIDGHHRPRPVSDDGARQVTKAGPGSLHAHDSCRTKARHAHAAPSSVRV